MRSPMIEHADYDIPLRRYDEIRAKCTLIPATQLLKTILEEKERIKRGN